MTRHLIPFMMLLLLMAGCNKDKNDQNLTGPPPPADDARTVLLKDVVVQSLPSPYFHFTYDNQQYVKGIDFAAGFFQYEVEYENKRVKKMTNLPNGNTIVYSYNNGLVSEVNELSGLTGNKVFQYKFFYNGNHQLVQMLWLDFNSSANGHVFKKAIFSYYPDGNLAKIEHYFDLSETQLVLEKTDFFSDYDNKTNVDDFHLVKEFFETYLFLPQVKLQKNNPRKQKIVTVQNDYEIVYTYTYQDNLPVSKFGIMTQTRGSGSGQMQELKTWFNYY